MKEDRIRTILREADQQASLPTLDLEQLPLQARQELTRRRNNARIGVAAAVLIAVGLGSLARFGPMFRTDAPERDPEVIAKTGGGSSGQAPAEVERLRREIEILESEARTARRLASQLHRMQAHAESVAAGRALSSVADPLVLVQRETEAAAYLIVRRGDSLAGRGDHEAEAIDAYRSAIELFPATEWAGVARERMTEIQTRSGEST